MKLITDQKSRGVLRVSIEAKSGDDLWILLRSDAHHDNAHCNHALEKKHLKECAERGGYVIDYGDLFCAMQGKWDKRASKDALPKELRDGNYLDALVKYNCEFYQPFADRFLQFSPGNHETSIIKRHETDLTMRLVERLNAGLDRDFPIYHGGFAGWVVFQFKISTAYDTRRLFYHHGYGGGGAVTRGVIQTNRMAVYLPDADIVASGHTHDEYALTIQRDRLTREGLQYQDEQLHLRTPGYKDEYADAHGGWHIERGAPPKPLGAYWLHFKCGRNAVETEAIRAK